MSESWCGDATGWRGEPDSWIDVIFPDRHVTQTDVQYMIGPEYEMYQSMWLQEAGNDG